ncbi:GGDEF domain-containing protein [Butyrivibrio sp. CB08]|uniref:sensor domain-containing diguanylate cyclase n=1 Tax=Butyrivibrio sp. CB08 TaxID=2364879 RepID=UPI000EA9AE08|nr:GGDEF domain-containing protein [Butyrivibrio sp. CB08]RKM61127.1 GGDEF domain-containing protein [Butyrivibrio sp. CB08]
MKDSKKTISTIVYYNLIFAGVVIVVFFYALFFTDVFNKDYKDHLRSFSGSWRDSSGNTYVVDEIEVKEFGGSATLANTLPTRLSDDDCLCFLSSNTNIKVYLDAEVVYSYDAKENLTGMGYGTVCHTVGLSKKHAGKSIIIEYSRVSIKATAGEIFNVYVGPASDYIHMMVRKDAISIILTLLIIFFGFAIVLIWAGISDKKNIPLDILDLGVGAGLFGMWLLAGMPVAQAVTGTVFFWRVLNRLLIMLLVYPFVRFFNSTTRQKKKIYEYIAFLATITVMIMIVGLRYYAEVDMVDSYVPFELASVAVMVILLVALIIDNYRYCKRESIPIKLNGIYVALIEMAVCSVIEVIIYFFHLWQHHFGNFIRIGMVLFITTVMAQFVNWWMRDQAAIDRDRFINRSIQVAMATSNPSDSIRVLLEYIAKELRASRAFIYEDKGDGKFRPSYEWFAEGLDPLPKDGLVLNQESCEKEFLEKMSDKPGLNAYGAIKSGSTVIGFLGVNNVAQERSRSLNEIVNIMTYFFAQFIGQRKEQERMLFYSYHDPVSGARNRSALSEFAEKKMDYGQPFGYVVCEVAGLREINDNLRHENTEQILKNTARCLMDAFGDDNVYAVSGEEFVCFGFENDEYYFINDVERAKRLFKERGCRTFIGASYCANGTSDIMNVIRYTRELLAKDRESQRGQ